MLSTLGEAPLNSIEEDHPMVASGVRQLRVVSYREQAKGWWFNKETVTLQPDAATGEVFVPGDCISVDPTDPYTHLVQRGRRLYDPTKQTYKLPNSVPVNMTRFVPFDDLPPTAAVYIGTSAVLMFQKSYDADPNKTRQLVADRGEALVALNSEHIRSMDVNILNRTSTSQRIANLGITARLGGLRIN
jgi:hypothetical protein